jgi:glycosyltransferase involved in cell wall biosynthesis
MTVALLMTGTVWGGAEVHAVQFMRTLTARGHRAIAVCLTQRTYEVNRERIPPDLAVVALPIPKASFEAMGFVDWVRLFRGQRWDVCLFIKNEIYAGGGWAIDLAARYRFGSYLTLEQLNVEPLPPRSRRRHFGVIPGLALWWYREQARRFVRSLGPRKIVCVSDGNRRRLVDDHYFPARKVATVCNGIDPRRFAPDRAHRANWRRRWGIPGDALVFGAVGRFSVMKGYDIALAGFQKLLSRFPEKDLRLVLVGEGTHEQALRLRAAEIAPAGLITFEGFCDRPWEPLNALDIFLMPSLNEGLPQSLVEAMACGCCPVATDVGGIPEVLRSPDVGWLVPAGDLDAFTTAMAAAATSSVEARAAMGVKARDVVLAHFNAATQFNALADIVESVAPPMQRGRNLAASPAHS